MVIESVSQRSHFTDFRKQRRLRSWLAGMQVFDSAGRQRADGWRGAGWASSGRCSPADMWGGEAHIGVDVSEMWKLRDLQCSSTLCDVLTYKGSPPRGPFTRAKQGYCSRENTADRAMTRPNSFPKWHPGKLHKRRRRGKDRDEWPRAWAQKLRNHWIFKD